ncbi:hypothetical protein [Paenibacillus spongiae]|uniref:Uncharacterized protein n=1 Tax=Paenibacillus spongiae TaxID=2909671 RepID=A0ABY5S2Q7_9BACL|nr:hypothetical protein [Paenibacillus spongiae]UVI28157.1 hypothetical protein L1F29_22225 [Paenibacillus spongiae]
MPFNEQLPEWNSQGVEPPQSKKNEGWLPSEKPPADYWNWQMNRAYNALKELQEKAAEKVMVEAMQVYKLTQDNGIAHVYGGNLDGLIATGIYYIPHSLSPKPAGFQTGLCEVYQIDANSRIQWLIDGNTMRPLVRYYNGNTGTWTSWTEQETTTGVQSKINAAITGLNFTAENILDKLKTIDGHGSGLDADLLDGMQPAVVVTPNTIIQRDPDGRAKVAAPATADDIARKAETDAALSAAQAAQTKADAALPAASYTAADVLGKLKSVDGNGSGLDADLLDGMQPAKAGTPNTIMQRDADGRAKAAAPVAADDIARRAEIEAPPFVTTTGTGTAYLADFTPPYSTLTAGTRITIKAHLTNTGSATINVNGLGAKLIMRSNGSALSTGNLKQNVVYTLVYDGSLAFTLQGEGGDYNIGDTIASTNLRKKNESAVEEWSSTEVSNGQGIAVDSTGNMYSAHRVAAGTKVIRKLDPSGSEIWSKTDVDNGKAVAVDSSGNVYCAHDVDTGGAKYIRKLNASGSEVWSKTDIRGGMGITVDASGNVYCAHDDIVTQSKAIRKLDASGAELWSKSDITRGFSITVDASGNVYCAHDGAIRKLNPSGGEVWRKTDVSGGRGIAIDVSGNVYCTHSLTVGNKTIRKLDPSGTEIWSNSEVANGSRVAVDAEGNAYCTYYTSGKTVRKLNSSGTEVWSKTDVSNGWGITVDASGNVYCAHSISSGKTVRKLNQAINYEIIS